MNAYTCQYVEKCIGFLNLERWLKWATLRFLINQALYTQSEVKLGTNKLFLSRDKTF